MPSLVHYLTVSLILFFIGMAGLLSRKNLFILFLSLELMLNGINLSLIAFSRFFRVLDGQVFVFLVITIAAAEAAIGLALLVLLFKNKATLNIDEYKMMKG